MDPSHPVVMDDGDLPWSDSHSMASDDSQDMAFPQSPPWMEAMSTGSAVSMSASISASSAGTSRLPLTGQLSPISTGMDIPPGPPTDSSACTSASGSSAAPTMVHSASSSVTDSWSIGGYGDLDSGSNDNGDSDMNDIHWEQGSDDVLTTLKDEPLDDDFRLEDIKEAPLTPVPSSNGPSSAQPKAKRPRGRPRKHPLTPIVPTNKVTKGRSKTGCITCRKRKKKCDEAKPRCMNCEKNAVVCEGYPEKQIWKSGKEKAEEGMDCIAASIVGVADFEPERMKTSGPLPVITMQPIFNGLENTEDMIFWKHYNDHLSAVLTVEGEHKNAFKDMLIPLATKHQGLMHSILALSSKHIDFETPYGLNILKRTQSTSLEALQQRSDYHHEKAMEKLYADIARQDHADRDDPEYKTMLSARYGQMLCLLLESLAEGNPRGEHRVHLQAYQTLIQHSPPEDPAFLTFISEFFQYHIFADELIRYPDIQTARLASEDWVPIVPIHPPRLLGVADGLFNHLCQITSVRNTIRANMAAHVDPVVDYTSLYRAAEIDAAIRDWTPQWPPGDSRDRVGLLYKQMMWVYLFRTIYPPSSSTNQSSLSNSSTSLPMLPGSSVGIGSSMANTANTPPRSASNSCASSPSLRPSISHTDITNPRRHSIAIHAHTQTERADSPPPFRQPPNHDPRITLAVDESLTILDSFKPSDPTQTLLLIPCLVIGTACFSPAQQERVRTAVRTVRGYTGLRNTDRVAEVLEEVWRCMERGEWARVWDWQGVARSLGVDFLCT